MGRSMSGAPFHPAHATATIMYSKMRLGRCVLPIAVPLGSYCTQVTNVLRQFSGRPLSSWQKKKYGTRRQGICHSRIIMGQYYAPCLVNLRAGEITVKAWLNCNQYRSGVKQMKHSYLDDPMVQAMEWLISPEGPHHMSQVVFAGDYGGVEEGYDMNLYDLCHQPDSMFPQESGAHYPLIVNHSKRRYIDKRKIEGNIHPLPLLTAETEGGGGGDYRGINQHFLGIWARDVISVEHNAPEGFKKVSYKFRE